MELEMTCALASSGLLDQCTTDAPLLLVVIVTSSRDNDRAAIGSGGGRSRGRLSHWSARRRVSACSSRNGVGGLDGR